MTNTYNRQLGVNQPLNIAIEQEKLPSNTSARLIIHPHNPSPTKQERILQVSLLEEHLYTAKSLDLFLWDWHTGHVQIEAADALVLMLVGMGHAKEVDASDEFGALETAGVGPDGVAFVF